MHLYNIINGIITKCKLALVRVTSLSTSIYIFVTVQESQLTMRLEHSHWIIGLEKDIIYSYSFARLVCIHLN